ncbi:MAG: Xaa-Pro peptidase family protein, partial [Acidobacteriaceae bacterium]
MAKDAQRRKMILHELQASRLEALASFSSTEVLLLTGYWPVMGTSLAICTRERGVCAVIPEDELELAASTSDVEFFAYKPESLEHLEPLTDVLADPVKNVVSRLNLKTGKIGINLGGEAQGSSYPSVHHFRLSILPLLQRSAPDLTSISADPIFERLKAVKTKTEIDILRRVCRRAAAGFCQAKYAIVAGRREDEVAADIEGAFARGADDGFERSKGYFFCMSGPNSYKASGAYARTRSRILREGDLVMIHANTVGDGYWADITRTWVVGSPNDQQQRMYDAIGEARQATLKTIAPGVSAKMVDGAARSVLDSHGFGAAFKHATGHGVGFTGADGHALPR